MSSHPLATAIYFGKAMNRDGGGFMEFDFIGIDHVQLAAPPACEPVARAFFGGILGWPELPKPEALRTRGGVWFRCGQHQVHIGVQPDFAPATKAHPAFAVKNLNRLRKRLTECGVSFTDDHARETEGADRIYVFDPFGNRLEFLKWQSSVE